MFAAYHVHQNLILALYNYFHNPDWSIPSNFPALARKLQDLQNGIQPNMVYSCEAPQERDLDLRLQKRHVHRAIEALSPRRQAVIKAAYLVTPQDPRLETGLTPLLVGLHKFSKWSPVEKHADDKKVLSAIRLELDELWRDAHREFEKAFYAAA